MKTLLHRIWGFFRSERFVSILLALLCGVSAVYALPPYGFIPVLFVAFGGLIFLLNGATSAKRAFALGYAFGFGFFSVGLAWVSNALLTEGMGFAALAPLPPIGFGVWGGFFPAFACLIAFYAAQGWRRLFAFAAAWGVFEWVRAWLFTGFPWNLIATVWTPYPEMLQTASIWGAYGLGMITVFAASLPDCPIYVLTFRNLLRRAKKRKIAVVCPPLKQRPPFKTMLSMFFSRKNSYRLAACSLLLFAMSGLTVFKTYYLVWGFVTAALAIAARAAGYISEKRNNN